MVESEVQKLISNEYCITVEKGVSLRILEILPSTDGKIKQVSLPTLIFIPGWISVFDTWGNILAFLKDYYRILYVETREKPTARLNSVKNLDFSIYRFAQDIAKVVDYFKLQDEKYYIAGVSLGANVVLQYLTDCIIKPAAAIAMLPNGDFKIPFWGRPFLYLPYWIYPMLKPIIKSYLYLFRSDRGQEKSMTHFIFQGLDTAEPKRLQLSARAFLNYTLDKELKEHQIPCLLVGSKLDRLHHSSTVQKLAKKLSNATYVEVASSGETHTEKAGKILVEYIQT